LRGGPSSEYEVSLNTGANMLSVLRELSHKYDPVDIFIDREGNWHIDGLRIEPHHIVHKVDFVLNGLHGAYGEDGKVQNIFEHFGIPFSGSGSLSSSITMNKGLTKKIFKDHGIKTPYSKEYSRSEEMSLDDIARNIFFTFPLPGVIKPMSGGSSIGVSIVHAMNEIMDGLNEAYKYDNCIIIEEYIKGREATCGVIDEFRGQHIYSLPVVEIVPNKSFFNYSSKYEPGGVHKFVPARFPHEIKKAIENISAKIHEIFGLRHYSRSDFIIHPKRGVYVLEVNTLPGLTNESLLPKSLKAVGSSVSELIQHIIDLEIKR
jgi:D-alanine-D-alanine ligase